MGNKNEIPQEVLAGFAEYGVNFFAIYDYTGVKHGDRIFCITEKPFEFKMAVNWTDTAKASLLKKLTELQGKAADIAQMVTKTDFSIVPAGEATYKKYTGVERMKYDTSVTVLDNNYTASLAKSKLSTSTEIESFLNAHAMPIVNDNMIKAFIDNFIDLPVQTADSAFGIVKIMKDTKVDSASMAAAGSVITNMRDCATELIEFANKTQATFKTALLKDLDEYVKAKNGVNTKVTIKEGWNKDLTADNAWKVLDDKIKLDFQDNNNETFIQFDFASDKDILKITHLKDEILSIQNDFCGMTEYSKVFDFYKERWLKEVKPEICKDDNDFTWRKVLKYYDIEENDVLNESGANSFLKETQAVTIRFTQGCEDIIKKYKDKCENVSLRDAEKIKQSKSKAHELADYVININKQYGEFNHRMSPCILYFSLAGMIFQEHVLITNWSQNENVWGFDTKFNISMEKAEIESWPVYLRERIFKPVDER